MGQDEIIVYPQTGPAAPHLISQGFIYRYPEGRNFINAEAHVKQGRKLMLNRVYLLFLP